MKRRAFKCTDDAFCNLIVAMNKKNKERVLVYRTDLEEVMDCHARSGLKRPWNILNGRKVEVDRERLFNFVCDHGECCGDYVGPDWVSDGAIRGRRMLANLEKVK